MRINDKFQLTYCTNIHPGSNWKTTFDSIKEHVPGIKNQVSKTKPFGLGLRLSNKASEELALGNRLTEFKSWLDENQIYVFTMNGFPYGNFHSERVKEEVHTPDWSSANRVTYTKRLFDQLSKLLPSGLSGGISTSPISYRHWHSSRKRTRQIFQEGAENLTEIIIHLYNHEKASGQYLHLDIEPEPDGMLENSTEVLDFFSDYLLPVSKPILADTLGLTKDQAMVAIYRYITVCYDICHFSLAYEDPADTFKKFASAGIRVGKIQVSAALKIISSAKGNEEIWKALSRFDEPTYLHQVTEKTENGVKTYNDLPVVLSEKRPFDELRAHFHVPIFLERFGALYSTQDHILKVFDFIKENAVSEHLEIETYTWEVLPYELKKDIADSIVRELNWCIEKMA